LQSLLLFWLYNGVVKGGISLPFVQAEVCEY